MIISFVKKIPHLKSLAVSRASHFKQVFSIHIKTLHLSYKGSDGALVRASRRRRKRNRRRRGRGRGREGRVSGSGSPFAGGVVVNHAYVDVPVLKYAVAAHRVVCERGESKWLEMVVRVMFLAYVVVRTLLVMINNKKKKK